MAGTYPGMRKPMVAPMKRDDRRRIPLTAFTLLTVPEEPMLSAYLRTKESVDVSLEKRMVGAGVRQPAGLLRASDSGRSVAGSSLAKDDPSRDNNITISTENVDLDFALDKFMAALTASESPDAVIKTIVGTKSSKPVRK